MSVEHVIELTVVGVNERDAIEPWRQRLTGLLEGGAIAIEPEDSTCTRFQKRARMPAETNRAVDEQTATPRAELFDNLGRQDGYVHDHTPSSERARASSSV